MKGFDIFDVGGIRMVFNKESLLNEGLVELLFVCGKGRHCGDGGQGERLIDYNLLHMKTIILCSVSG